jgi:hypothetical protein
MKFIEELKVVLNKVSIFVYLLEKNIVSSRRNVDVRNEWLLLI